MDLLALVLSETLLARFNMAPRGDRISGFLAGPILNGFDDHASHDRFAEFRADEQVVQVEILPMTPEIHSDVVRAPLIGIANQARNVFGCWRPFPHTRNSLGQWSMNENVKSVSTILQHTLSSPADDHAVAPRVRFVDQIPLQCGRGFRIKKLCVSDRRDSLERPVPEAPPADAV
jgi:hypothetical protein